MKDMTATKKKTGKKKRGRFEARTLGPVPIDAEVSRMLEEIKEATDYPYDTIIVRRAIKKYHAEVCGAIKKYHAEVCG